MSADITPKEMKFYTWGGGLLLLFLMIIYPNQIDWQVDQSDSYSIFAYPDPENVKNYELPVDMKATEFRHGLRHNYFQYDIKRLTFPDDGTLEFKTCIVHDSDLSRCIDQNGKTWGIKVPSPPPKPEADS